MNTTSTYLYIEKNLTHYQAMTAADPTVKADTAYYNANIGKVTSAKGLVANYRLLSYALDAYGLGDQINNKQLITKVLEGGTTSSKALANTLPNASWKAFAKAFDFTQKGTSSPTSSASVATTTADYKEQKLEADQGATDPGVELALYFKRVAPTVTNGYGLLADQNLLKVVQTAYDLAPTTNSAGLDREATAIKKLAPTADLTDPTKLNKIIEKFTAAYDKKYGTASDNPGGLTVNNGNTAAVTPASQTILSNLLSNTAGNLASEFPQPTFSAGLLYSLQGLSLGGH